MHYRCYQIKGEGPSPFHSKSHPTVFWLTLHLRPQEGDCWQYFSLPELSLLLSRERVERREGWRTETKGKGVPEERKGGAHPLLCLPSLQADTLSIYGQKGAPISVSSTDCFQLPCPHPTN